MFHRPRRAPQERIRWSDGCVRLLVELVGDHRRKRFFGTDARDRIFRIEVAPNPLRRAFDHAKDRVGQLPCHGAPMTDGSESGKASVSNARLPRLFQSAKAWAPSSLRSEEHTSELQSLMRIS